MNHFPGYPPKKHKLKKQGDDSGTESAGTDMSSNYAMSRVTPAFHLVSDQEQIETPKKKRIQKEAPSTQGFIQDLVEQNQRSSPMNGLFGSLYSFGGKQEDVGSHDIFGMTFGNQNYNSYQQSFGKNQPFSFSGENEPQDQYYFNEQFNNWSSPIAFDCLKNEERNIDLLKDFRSFSFQKNNQQDEKYTTFKKPIKQSLIQSFNKNNPSTIIEVREDLEGLTNPIDGTSQQNTQIGAKESSETQNGQHSAKRSETDHENLKQSIIKVLSEMDSDEWSQNKSSEPSKMLGIKDKTEEEKATHKDDLSDSVNSFSKCVNKDFPEQKIFKTLTGSQKKKVQIPNETEEFNHRNSTKTFFQFKKRNNQGSSIQIGKNQEPPFLKTKSFYDENQFEKKQKTNKRQFLLQTTFTSNFVESKVAEINLDNLDSIQREIIPSKSHDISDKKQQIEGSFFKNKPFDRLIQRNQRKNNFLRTEKSEIPQKEEKKINDEVKKSDKPTRKSLFTAFMGNRTKNSHENSPIQCFHTNPLPTENFEDSYSQTATKPYEHYSQGMQIFQDFEIKTHRFENLQSPGDRHQFFGKRNRKSNAKKNSVDIQTQKKSIDLKMKSSQQLFANFNPTKIQPELKEKEQKTIHLDQKDEKSNFKTNKIHFLKQNEHGRVKITKIQTKEEMKVSNKVAISNPIDKKPGQKQFFGFERRKDKSKVSKASNYSNTSSNNEMKLDMKGILEKVNEPKQNNKKINFKGSMVENDQKPKFSLDFKNRNRFPSLKQNKNEGKNQEVYAQNSQKINENQLKRERKSKFSSYIDLNSRQKKQDNSISKEKIKPSNERDQNLTIQKEKPRQISTIPKYIFSKKTPPKNALKTPQQTDKRQSSVLNTPRNIEFEEEKVESSTEKPKKLFESRRKFTVESVTRSNYMITKEKEGFKEETESQKMKHRIRREDSFDYSSLTSKSSTQSDLIKEVDNLIELADVAKRRMRKKRQQSEEFLHKTMVLKKKVEEMFPEERIKRLMDWKYV